MPMVPDRDAGMHSLRIFLSFFFIELCWGKAMVAYYNASTKEQRRKRKAKRRER